MPAILPPRRICFAFSRLFLAASSSNLHVAVKNTHTGSADITSLPIAPWTCLNDRPFPENGSL